MNPYLKQYQTSQIQTASPEKILIMLYDGAIQFLNKAKKELENKNIQEVHNNIIGAQKIVAEFMNTLDMEIGGATAVNLYNLYEYMHFRLVQANMKKDVAMIDEVLIHLKDLKSTWEEAIRIANREKSSVNMLDDEEDEEDSIRKA
ncbi:MAG: flagellar export chaperone FliS [bacterium]